MRLGRLYDRIGFRVEFLQGSFNTRRKVPREMNEIKPFMVHLSVIIGGKISITRKLVYVHNVN